VNLATQTEKVILVVDDEEELVEIIIERLNSWGFKALGAFNVSQAISQLRNHGVDIILSDLRMPGADGLDLLRKIQNIAGIGAPVLYFVSSHSDLPEVELMNRGAAGFIEKPIAWTQLKACLEETISDISQLRTGWRRPLRFKTQGRIAFAPESSDQNLSICKEMPLIELNLSTGGFFGEINGSTDLAPGQIVRFCLELMDLGYPASLEGQAEIRWVKIAPKAETSVVIEGSKAMTGTGTKSHSTTFGCKFVSLEKGDVNQILATLETRP
jgi:CheY-like chemotaxis protein